MSRILKVKELTTFRIKNLIILAALLLFTKSVFATTGGPTYIEKLSYDPRGNSLYYLVDDQGGRGCPPEIEKLDLTSLQRSLVMPCDKIEATYRTEDGLFDASKYDQFVQNTFKAWTGLKSISLQKNNISVAVSYIGEHRFDEYNISSDFQASVFQDGKEKGKFDFIGCHRDQPNVFRGYFIPNTQKLAIIASRIGNCFEGGYLMDDVFVVDGIDFRDTTTEEYPRDYSVPAVEGNIVVSAQETSTPQVSPPEKTKKTYVSILWGIAVAVSFGVGYLAGRKQKHSQIKDGHI